MKSFRVSVLSAFLLVLGLSLPSPLGAQGQAILQVTPTSLSFEGRVDGPDPSPQALTLSITGQGVFEWHASADVDWITLGATEGALSGGRAIQLAVLVDTQELDAGIYKGTIAISDPNAQGNPAIVNALLQVERSTVRTLGFGDVRSVVFSPDGQYLAAVGGGSSVKLVDTSTWQVVRTLEGHTGDVNSVAFSLDGTLLASGSWDETVKLWEVNTGKELRTLEGHNGPVLSVAFSPDGMMLAFGSWDNTIKLWDVSDLAGQ